MKNLSSKNLFLGFAICGTLSVMNHSARGAENILDGRIQGGLNGNGKAGTNFSVLSASNFVNATTGLSITNSFDTNQFNITNQAVHIKNGVAFTNAVFRGTTTLPGYVLSLDGNATNLSVSGLKIPDGVTEGYVLTAVSGDGAAAWSALPPGFTNPQVFDENRVPTGMFGQDSVGIYFKLNLDLADNVTAPNDSSTVKFSIETSTSGGFDGARFGYNPIGEEFFPYSIPWQLHFANGNTEQTGLAAAAGFSGSGASLTNLSASALASGVVPNARLSASTTSNGYVFVYNGATGTRDWTNRIYTAALTNSGNLQSATLNATNYLTSGSLTNNGNLQSVTLNTTGYLISASHTNSGNLQSATLNTTGSLISASHTNTGNLQSATLNTTSYLLSAGHTNSGNLQSATLNTTGSLISANHTNSGNLESATISTTGAATFGGKVTTGAGTLSSLGLSVGSNSGLSEYNGVWLFGLHNTEPVLYARKGVQVSVASDVKFGFSSSASDPSAVDTYLVRSAAGRLSANGSIAATNGFSSFNRNKLPLIAISPSGSPYNFTNTTTTNNIVVFIGGTEIEDIAINGTSLSMTQGSCPLQPGEWVTVTYTNPPVMYWKPF